MSTRVMYPAEIKEKAIKMKLAGKSTKEIMRTLNIKNPTQVKIWWRWYRNEETHRFHQGVGKQYKYQKGVPELPEIEQLKIALRQKELELEIFKKVQGIGKEVNPAYFVLLVEELKTKYLVKDICQILQVPLSTYYRWKKKDFAQSSLEKKIGQLCKTYQFTYGYRKIAALMKQEEQVGINKVQRIMQKYQWQCQVKVKKKNRPGSAYYQTENHLNRNFQASQPLEKLTTDITYLYFGDCRLYLSSIMDLYNGEIVAYSIGEKQDTELVLDTLNQLSLPEGSLLHSDQGSVYTSYEYYQCCKKKNVIRSMSRKGTPADNAPIECFHSSLKCETFYHKTAYKYAKSIVIQIVKDYIKYYNEKRIQQKLGYQSPINFRKQAA
ncbi:IS3 family transposase [Listeria monocytogenes]|uniref:IS3-like element ISLmo1 family transposase n=6 Tax=Listeria monocytogenes TaxID=1639 RepID=UPI000FD63C2D|nr:IS3-like element ISLmo1 family transposase [Listeria monocytogenes]EAC4382811.1 IS3 family transposase [Listeria monocytogenes]EAC4730571.1 IS3 family transposase [Listeria monocytogenes]EAC5657722.1 IS3 family transposase [Listeria monocytogenes]EAC6775504.1 IS3 family transposase [Listeria monocytogenes]EAD1031085.1 IS3 family transposase [Listeria monocytogenes]